MPIDLSALSQASNGISTLSNLILATPSSQGGITPFPPNADGTINFTVPAPVFVFDYEGEQSLQFKSDITDHYIEDNTSIQDHIALPPERITTHGFIGELNDITPKLLQPLKTAALKLTTLVAYAPAVSETADIAFQEAQYAYQLAINAANAAVSAWTSIAGGGGGKPVQSKQQVALTTLYQYWAKRSLFTVQTPWAIFTNMAIESCRAVQDESTDQVSEFELTFKQMRFTQGIGQSGTLISTGRSDLPSSPADLGTGQTGADTPFSTTA